MLKAIFSVAGLTYGPLLGLYAFGLFTKWKIKDRMSIYVCIISPILAFAMQYLLKEYADYKIGFEILIYNGIFTFLGLWLVKTDKMTSEESQEAIGKKPAQA